MPILKSRTKSNKTPTTLNTSKPIKEEEKNKRFNFAVPANIHAKVKATCAYKGISMQEFVLSALILEIKRIENNK